MASRRPNTAEIRVRTVVAPYLKALRIQVVFLVLSPSSVREWRSGRPRRRGHAILTLVPAISNPFRRSHIFAVSRHDGYLGGCRNQRSSFRELMEPSRLSPVDETA
jgi:hypothetical protein